MTSFRSLSGSFISCLDWKERSRNRPLHSTNRKSSAELRQWGWLYTNIQLFPEISFSSPVTPMSLNYSPAPHYSTIKLFSLILLETQFRKPNSKPETPPETSTTAGALSCPSVTPRMRRIQRRIRRMTSRPSCLWVRSLTGVRLCSMTMRWRSLTIPPTLTIAAVSLLIISAFQEITLCFSLFLTLLWFWVPRIMFHLLWFPWSGWIKKCNSFKPWNLYASL